MSRQFCRDRLGFPMVWIPHLEIYIHWFPITKLQFESFLCDHSEGDLSAAWYQAVLQGNPRIATDGLSFHNFHHAFITGIRAEEARRFANWNGDGFRLPSADEWAESFRWLSEQNAEPPTWTFYGLRYRRFERLFTRLMETRVESQFLGSEADLATTMLMVGGILEWVREKHSTEPDSACGLPPAHFFPVLKRPESTVQPLHLQKKVTAYPFGARLVFDPAEHTQREQEEGESCSLG